jgi:hypothetical protein
LVFFTLLAPVCALGAPPTTVGEQVAYLADRYANGLDCRFGDTLSTAAIAANKAQLSEGLAALITKPLGSDELLELGQWMERQGVPHFDRPVDLELAPVTRNLIEDTRQYLSRQPWDAHLILAIEAQAGEVLDALRKEMIVQWRELVPDVEAKAAGIVSSQTFPIGEAANSHISPFIKRLFTQAEMDALVAFAQKKARDERQHWEDFGARMSPEMRAVFAADPEPMRVHMVVTAAQVQYQIMATSYKPPSGVGVMPEEFKAILEARDARDAAEAGQP